MGFKMAGHEIIWANDLYEDAVETYKRNLGDHIVCEDISKIDAEEIPECDIIIGGFPCQGFSVANMKRHEADERNALYKQLIRVIEAKKPKFFLAENVKGLTNLAKGAVFKMILSDFAALGYKVSYDRCTHVGQDGAAVRSCQHPRQIQNDHAVQKPFIFTHLKHLVISSIFI